MNNELLQVHVSADRVRRASRPVLLVALLLGWNVSAVMQESGRLIDLNSRIDHDADVLPVAVDEIKDSTRILARSCDRGGVFC